MTIQKYFADKEILVTGVTGLVGKALLEKLLRDLPDVRRVHLLVRGRVTRNGRRVSPQERLEAEILSSSAFDRLRQERGPEGFADLVRDKVRVVAGDLSEEGLGIDPDARRDLQRSVKLIVNCAATVSFDASLREALEINTLGPLRVLDFARGCDAPLVAQVSTCYVHGTREGDGPETPLDPGEDLLAAPGSRDGAYDVDREVEVVRERIRQVERRSRGRLRRAAFAYAARREAKGADERPRRAEELRREWVERELSEEGTRSARRRGWHDVYTYTKAMGEQLMARDDSGVDTVIFRPSIIESAVDEPTSGWLEGFRMMDPLIVAYGRRQLDDFPANTTSIMDLVPVDKVVNALLACIPTGQGKGRPVVYQLATGHDNRLTFESFADLVQEHFEREPLSSRDGSAKAMPRLTFTPGPRFMLRLRLRYKLPLAVLYAVSVLGWPIPWVRRARATLRARRSAVGRLARWVHIYSPYSEVYRRYRSDRMWDVLEGLSPGERETFDFDVRSLDWRFYIQDVHIPGIKRFLLGMDSGVGDSTGSTGQGDGRQKSLISSLPDPALVASHLGGQWLRRPARTVTRWLWSIGYRRYLGMKVEGVEKVPGAGPFIVVSNHNSHLDTGALLVILANRRRCLHPLAAKDYWFRNRLAGWVSHTFIDAVPFDRNSQFAQSLGLGVALLRMNHSLLFFPEGGRSTSGKMRAFKAGIGVLALESGAPIVPARITGSYESMAKGSWFPKRRGGIHVRFGPAISVEPYLEADDVDTTELARQVTDEVQRAVEALD